MIIGPGSVVGGYRIERALGSGGMGTVYLAAHPNLPRHDALKVLWPHLATDPEYRARFEREANLAAALDHPNIVTVHNRGEDQGCLWIALQYINGTDAAAAMDRDPRSMTSQRALRIVTEVGKGLDHAHRRGMLHRDVKPANFLLSQDDRGSERVLLADFGIAKTAEDATQLTRTGTFMATVAYASPEQLSGDQLDNHSDIYSLGCSFYRMLTGQNPYPGTQPLTVMMGHINEPPPRISAVRPDLPVVLDDVFARVLAKEPHQRFSSCLEFTDAAASAFTAQSARSAPTIRNAVAGPSEAESRPSTVVDTGPPLLTPFEAPLFGPKRSSTAPKTPEVLDHETEWSPFRRIAAVGIIAALSIITVSVVLGKPFQKDDDRESSSTVPGTTVSSASVSASPAGLQDPCLLVSSDLRQEFGLSAFGRRNDTTDQRRCDWQPGADAARPLSAYVSMLAKPTPTDPAGRPVEVWSPSYGGQVSQGQVTTGPSDTDPGSWTCTVSWPTSYGSAQVAMTGSSATFESDDACGRAETLAQKIYHNVLR